MRLFLVVCLVLSAGCDKPGVARPAVSTAPEFKVSRTDVLGKTTGVTVYYQNFKSDRFATYVTLNDIDSLKAYRRQVEFLAAQLAEAEAKMTTNEQDAP